jgi:hypothetical protein
MRLSPKSIYFKKYSKNEKVINPNEDFRKKLSK